MSYNKPAALMSSAMITSCALAGGVIDANARFARDMYASRASILIIGDSTNNPEGAGAFVPYYEGLIQSLPQEVELCGFRVSGSTGNTSVNGYIRFNGGSVSQMVQGGVVQRAQDIFVDGTSHAPPSYRNEFTIVDEGVLWHHSRFASVGLTNLQGIYARGEEWANSATLVLRTPFFVTDDQTTLPSVSMHKLTDHDGSAGTNVGGYESGPAINIQFDTNRIGLQAIDAVFENPQTSRIGVRFSGDTDTNDSNESGKVVAWSDHILFDRNRAELDRGIYFDSVSIGGFSARDHFQTLDPLVFDDYFAVAPRPYNAVVIWLGQNVAFDEWNGIVLAPQWGQRIEAIADMAIEAAIDAGYSDLPVPILITPPLTDDEYPGNRFTAMNEALDEIATRRGWGHIDIQTLIGNSLFLIDPSLLGPGPHPSQSGSLFVSELIYEYLSCQRAEYTGDGIRNFFDVATFLTLFMDSDSQADLNGDGAHNFFDISAFLDAYFADCP